MKKLLAILILSISLIGIGNAQTTGKLVSNGTVWSDSLGYSGSPPAGTADSVFVLDVNFVYESYRIFLEGNANSSVDSVAVQVGSVGYNESLAAVDTVWGSYTGVKIAAGTYNVRMVNTATGADFILADAPIQLLKFSLINYRAALLTRNVRLVINGLRK